MERRTLWIKWMYFLQNEYAWCQLYSKYTCGVFFKNPRACKPWLQSLIWVHENLHKEQIYRDLKRYEDLDFSRLAMYEGFCLRRKRACIRLRVVDGIPYILDMCLGPIWSFKRDSNHIAGSGFGAWGGSGCFFVGKWSIKLGFPKAIVPGDSYWEGVVSINFHLL